MIGEKLTKRQKQILDFIEEFIIKKAYPPSVREICKAVGLSSPATVQSHLDKLKTKGYIKRDPLKPRTIEIISPSKKYEGILGKKFVSVPIVGKIAAGIPLLAEQNIDEYFPLPTNFISSKDNFILRVKGESMINAAIKPGDLLVTKKQNTAENGDIVIALVEDEATVKRFFKEDGKIRLQPENDLMEPIILSNVKILGKVIALIRKI
ncbi:MAG: transcriptional repressor LexA, partial [Actinobacteria bacterium]|nr:transcriptional repressor LexA [Actinomycetota bacterium]